MENLYLFSSCLEEQKERSLQAMPPRVAAAVWISFIRE